MTDLRGFKTTPRFLKTTIGGGTDGSFSNKGGDPNFIDKNVKKSNGNSSNTSGSGKDKDGGLNCPRCGDPCVPVDTFVRKY